MHNAGWKFREVRERLNLTYRDIEEATQTIANGKLNPEYLVNISRLFEIENKNLVPTLYRVYSLCVVYRLNFMEVLRWYGLDLHVLQQEIELFSRDKTHLVTESPDTGRQIDLPIRLDPGLNVRQTSYLSRMIETWGTVPLAMLRQLDLRNYRYGHIGLDDWMMYPLITPGALVQIDTERQEVEGRGWRNEFERPIYFLETHAGYVCCWIMPLEEDQLLLQPYSLSPCKATVKVVPHQAEIVGQVTGVAMRLTGAPRGKARTA